MTSYRYKDFNRSAYLISSLLYNYFSSPLPSSPLLSFPIKSWCGGEVSLPSIIIIYVNEYPSELMTEL